MVEQHAGCGQAATERDDYGEQAARRCLQTHARVLVYQRIQLQILQTIRANQRSSRQEIPLDRQARLPQLHGGHRV